MWPLGHVAVAYLCYTIATRARFDAPPAHVPALILVIGSQFPDLVDKPLAWYLGVIPTGRTLAHSLLVLVPLTFAVLVLSSHYNRSEYGIVFAIGALSHVLVDAVPALWGPNESATHLLWPVVPVEEYEQGAPSILALFQESLGQPFFLAEFALAAVALVCWHRHGYPGLEPVRTVFGRVWPTLG